ncbi:MAG: SPOR domain-containing protein [Alphaproteobacteria bacterium]|nr:SPOR domain-containing protein [Alphaproteobacteria bacterium]
MADDKLDLLDLDDEIDLPELPEGEGFGASRPRRPWLLFGAALIVVILATYIIVRIVMHGPRNDMAEIDLTMPAPAVEQTAPGQDFAAQADRVIEGQAPTAGTPVRVVEERQDVVFKPDAPKVEPPKPRPIEPAKTATAAKPAAPAAKPVVKPQASSASNFYVQFGSYSARAAAEAAQKKIQSKSPSLFSGHQFVILAAVLPNGATTYRLRVGFTNVDDANNLCRNAKSDGLDCYVTK